MTSAQMYAELIALRNHAGESLFARLTLADQLLKDREWVRDPAQGGGDESRALDRLEEDCFGDICGALSLPQMLEILHHIPSKEDWKKRKYNLKRMYAEMLERRPKPAMHKAPADGAFATVGAARTAPSQDELSSLRSENAQLKRQVETLTSENKRLRKTIQRIRKDIGELQTA